ncbi:MAG TPA: G1 family glutamic endopeptidase [Acidimicrobiales bacterium]|nr:G1 family glutamic endopeptidase [Acidimicrobiales bacterium]
MSSIRPSALAASVLVPAAAALALVLPMGAVAGATVAGAGAHRTIVVAATGQSNNWSGYNQGYLEKNTLFKSISGQWVVPTATYRSGGPTTENSASWVGIGGGCLNTSCSLTDASSLIQAGTEQDVSSDGTTSYSAWWEIVPAPQVSVSTVAVHPGDLVSVSIAYTVPELWTITLTDRTDGQGFTQTVPYPSTMLTAEWIEEAPIVVGGGSAGEASLPNLSTVHFDSATVNGHSAGLSPAEEVQMVSTTNQIDATPSSPDLEGDGFNDCTYAATCGAP